MSVRHQGTLPTMMSGMHPRMPVNSQIENKYASMSPEEKMEDMAKPKDFDDVASTIHQTTTTTFIGSHKVCPLFYHQED